METPDDERRFRIAFAVCAAACLLPIWAVKYLPMVDLPQHTALVSIWRHLDDPRFGFAPYFELHLATPYLLAYAIARGLAGLFSVRIALKLVVTLAVLALPAGLAVFFRRMRVSVWWSLLGFPLAFGSSFQWGFVSFMLGLPLAFLYFAIAEAYAAAPGLGAGLLLALATALLFPVHGLLFVFCPVVAAARIVAPGGGRALLRVWPLALPLPLALAWLKLHPMPDPVPLAWGLGPERIGELFALIGYRRPLLLPLSVALAVLVILRREPGAARARLAERLPALLLAAAAVLFWPGLSFGGVAHVAPRFNVFWLPFLVAWLRPRLSPGIERGLVAGVVLLAVGLTLEFRRFDVDARAYDRVATSIAPRSRIRSIIFCAPDEIAFLHFPVWTQAETGGLNGASFASNPRVPVRYRASAPRLMSRNEEWHPESFDWRRELPRGYDAFVMFSRVDRSAALFAGAPVALVAHDGPWWLYRRR